MPEESLWCAEILPKGKALLCKRQLAGLSDEGVGPNESKERQLDDVARLVARDRKVVQCFGDPPLVRRFRNAPLDHGCHQLRIAQAQGWQAVAQNTAIERW